MTRRGFILKALLSLTLMSFFPSSAFAAQYTCTITGVLGLTDSGQYATHEWENFYLGRKFVVDREPGKVISTTALKARLKNFDEIHSPRVLSRGDGKSPFKSITMIEETGELSVLQINENAAGPQKPFYYQTFIGMLLAGTCAGGAQ